MGLMVAADPRRFRLADAVVKGAKVRDVSLAARPGSTSGRKLSCWDRKGAAGETRDGDLMDIASGASGKLGQIPLK